MALRTDEAVSLLIGLSLLAELPGGVDRDLIDQVVAKLQDVAGEASDTWATISIATPTEDQSRRIREVLDEALRRRRQVAMSYLVPTRDEVTERTVEPQQVLLAHGHVYLRAWCHLAGGPRTFRVDRILTATVLDEAVDPQHALESDATRGPGDVFSGGPDLPVVTLDLTPRGRWISEYAPIESSLDRPDGGLRVSIRVADERWIERLVLQAGGEATVVAPESLVTRLAQRAEQALAAYS